MLNTGTTFHTFSLLTVRHNCHQSKFVTPAENCN